MRKSSALHVGLDVHANSIDVTVAEADAAREVRHVGSVGGDLVSLDRVLRKLRGEGAKLHVVYEAGPCGFVIARHLRGCGIDCEVVAPSMIPRRPGERIKTDRRDSMKCALTANRQRSRVCSASRTTSSAARTRSGSPASSSKWANSKSSRAS